MRIRILLITGFLLIFGCLNLSAQDGLFVNKIIFSGNDSLSVKSLLMQMNTRPRSFQQKLSFWKKGERFSSSAFEEDIIKLKKYYQKNGFLSPEISYRLLPNKKDRKLNIKINIKEGPSVLISKINYRFPVDGTFKQSMDSIEKKIPLKADKRFRDEDVIATEKIIYNYFSKKGYPFIRVKTNITLNQEKQTSKVEFNIVPGNKIYIGDIKIQGDSLISRSYIREYINIKENDIFSQIRLEKTQEELFDMSLFRYVTIRAMMDSVEKDRIPILIKVKELPRWSVETGFGYGTEDKVRVSVLLKRLNFLGGGRTLIVKSNHSYYVPLSMELRFIQPHIWKKNTDFIFNPFFSREREDSYDVDRLGTSFTLQKKLKNKASAYISYTYGKDKVNMTGEDITTDDEDIEDINSTKSGITFGYNRSNVNDMFSPSKGWKLSGTATYMGLGLNSQYHYYKLITEVDYFHSLAGNVVFAGKLKGGMMKPVQGDAETPLEDRFLIGGSLSLRGWGYHQISPLDDDGDKTGGNSMIESSMELRFPLFGIFSGVTFMDMGNVWPDSWNFELGSLQYDAGLGLRVKTPVGPFRVDVATPVFDGKLSTQLFVTIGHAF